MSKLWLTYAWKDNEDQDVDFVIADLKSSGVNVRYDRVQLLAGRRLWEQIDAGIRDPDITAWAIYVTENSLRSEPCQEELAYALDRTLRTRGSGFPLIGLFSGDFDAELIPSALATRLCVNLHHNDWKQQIVDTLAGKRNDEVEAPNPFGHKLHAWKGEFVLEIWPRTGTWSPFVAVVNEADEDLLKQLTFGPRGLFDGACMVAFSTGKENGNFFRMMQNPINSSTSAFIWLKRVPAWVKFGQNGGPIFTCFFDQAQSLLPAGDVSGVLKAPVL